jgi:hypothetical protein
VYVDDVSTLPAKRELGADRLMIWLGEDARRLGCDRSR